MRLAALWPQLLLSPYQIVKQKEKDKRQKWLTLQTQRIKEATVKGLEPEIQRLIAQHKTEVRGKEASFPLPADL